jgi:hypothetical protein
MLRQVRQDVERIAHREDDAARVRYRGRGCEQIEASKGRIALHPYQPSARRVYQPAALP